MLEEQEFYLTIHEVAACICMPPQDVRGLIRDGQLSAMICDGVMVVSESDVSRFLGDY